MLNLFTLELQLISSKPVIKNKLKVLLSKLRKVKVQTILVLDYKKTNDCKIIHLCTKLIASNSDLNEVYNQNIMTKIKYTKLNLCFLRV